MPVTESRPQEKPKEDSPAALHLSLSLDLPEEATEATEVPAIVRPKDATEESTVEPAHTAVVAPTKMEPVLKRPGPDEDGWIRADKEHKPVPDVPKPITMTVPLVAKETPSSVDEYATPSSPDKAALPTTTEAAPAAEEESMEWQSKRALPTVVPNPQKLKKQKFGDDTEPEEDSPESPKVEEKKRPKKKGKKHPKAKSKTTKKKKKETRQRSSSSSGSSSSESDTMDVDWKTGSVVAEEQTEEESATLEMSTDKQPAPDAKPSTLFRGFTFCLTGLMPGTSKQITTIIGSSTVLSPMALYSHVTCSTKKTKARPGNAHTLLLSREPTRTIKYLLAVSLGVPCVSSDFVTESAAAGKLLSYQDFLLQDEQPVPAYPLDGLRTEVLGKNREDWELVVRAAGGKPVQRLYTADEQRIDYVLLPNATERTQPIEQFLRRASKNAIPIITSDWLIKCITTRELVDPSTDPGKFTIPPVEGGSTSASSSAEKP